MSITRSEAESYLDKYVVITWDQTAEEQAYYGCKDGSMEGVVANVTREDWLELDWGYGIRLDKIKSIRETQEP